MRYVSRALAVLAVLSFVGFASAEDPKPKKEKPAAAKALRGKVVKVDGTNVTIKVKDEDKVVATDASTKVTIDGKDAAVADLKEGMLAAVTPDTGTAAKIDAKTAVKKQGGEKKANGDKKE